jgi:hypothetical protein
VYFAGGAYAVFAIACGVGAGLIGRGKGQSFWIWFAVAAVLPLIGNLAAAVSRNENDEERRLCPTCQHVCKAYDAKCMKCGTELEFPTDAEMLPSVNELAAMRAAQQA